MELMTVLLLILGFAPVAFAVHGGMPMWVAVGIWAIGFIVTMTTLVALRVHGKNLVDTFQAALVVSFAWMFVVPSAAAIHLVVIISGALEPYWTRICAWWERPSTSG